MFLYQFDIYYQFDNYSTKPSQNAETLTVLYDKQVQIKVRNLTD